MIIVPVLLRGVLADVDIPVRRQIALDFARHLLDTCGDALEHAHRDVVTAYLTAAVDAESHTESAPDKFAALVDARARFFEALSEDVRSLPHRVGWTVNMAFDSCFLRDLRSAKVVISGSSWVPSLLDVAKEAQSVAGEYAGQGCDRTDAGDVRSARRAASWEEARWQLIHVIATARMPP